MELKNRSHAKQKKKNGNRKNSDKSGKQGVGIDPSSPQGTKLLPVKVRQPRLGRVTSSKSIQGAIDIAAEKISGKIVGIKKSGRDAIIYQLKSGLPVKAFESLRIELGIPASELAETINISNRTLARRRQSGTLSRDESEKVYRIAQLIDQATRVLGDKEKGKRWLTSPKKALKDKTPLEYADTELGAKEVENLLGRLEHGVFT